VSLQRVVVWSFVPLARGRGKGKEKNEWAKELKFDRVLCKCGIEAKYGLVLSELGVGYFCRHMVDYDEVAIYLLFPLALMLHPYLLFFCRRRGNAVGRVTTTKERWCAQ
jgi:hypothetical protein